jgi:hypothetical protein
MKCQKCSSSNIIRVSAKCDDRCHVTFDDYESCDYAPSNIGLGLGGDYLNFSYCGDCGQIQGTFPLEIFQPEEVDTSHEFTNLGDMIEYFYSNLLLVPHNVSVSNLKTFSKFISPTEQEMLDHVWMMYNEMKTMNSPFPEFDNFIQYLIDRYKSLKVRTEIRVY